MIFALLIACSSPTPSTPPTYVRGGRISDDGARALPDGRKFTPLGPHQRYQDEERPLLPDCVGLFSIDLGEISHLISAGITAPDTSVAFSPDGAQLAIGSYLGDLLVVDAWTGELRGKRHLAESAIKRVAWSPDGTELYAAEQSVDAFLHAVDPNTLEDRAIFRLADALGTSAPPGRDDLFGLYTLPGPYALEVLPNGDLIVVGAHGWNQGGVRKNRSLVYRLHREGKEFQLVAQWPKEPADATFLAATIDGPTMAVSVSRSASGSAPELPINGAALLRTEDLSFVSGAVPPPLTPWFDRAFIWESLGLHEERVTLGLGDGRVWRPDRSRNLGTPILAADVPIAATIGRLVDAGDAIYTLTSGTSIPFGSAKPDAKPPQAHPAENTLWSLDPNTLETQWVWHGDEAVHGFSVSSPWLVLGVGPREGNLRSDKHGVRVFDTAQPGSGDQRVVTFAAQSNQSSFDKRSRAMGGLLWCLFPRSLAKKCKVPTRLRSFYRVFLLPLLCTGATSDPCSTERLVD